ncbi:MAG TPA: hypothetical protein VNO21_01735, partial [Polyangiaceae bacterium]|nr:hypothetical protein [Polyangiaceae bacterium]
MRKTLSRAHDAAAERGGDVERYARGGAQVTLAKRTSRWGSAGGIVATHGALGWSASCAEAALSNDGSVPRSQQQDISTDAVRLASGDA